ncbi:MAG TPA: trehalose-6-phosphate synthase [Egibacteraceae bacterium]|nr:trehalose-6-phosphate synthase [Egibacteraceae bacterium]
MADAPPALVVASNRGPVSWQRRDGQLRPKRGFGGLVTALGGVLQREPGTWVSVALDHADREVAAEHGATAFEEDADGGRYRLRLLDVGDRYEPYYNEVANRLLWFTLHELWAAPFEPPGTGWRGPWEDGYLPVNAEVGRAVAAEADADRSEVLLQDYHLCTAGESVREALPEAAILHYLHTPWVEPSYLARLPDEMTARILRGLLAADVVAFSSPQWTRAFRRCAIEHVGAAADGDALLFEGRRVAVDWFALGVDEGSLAESAASGETVAAGDDLDAEIDGRLLLLRVDRTDLSKNILRGLLAYEVLLEQHPQLRGRVWHYGHLNPSRQGVAEYQTYLEACEEAAARIKERFGESTCTLFVGDDYPRAVAALQRYDVLLTNPVMDGTNLVAKEGPVLNRRDGALVLSPRAGAADLMGEGALVINPYDVEAQAAALHAALTMSADERAARADLLRRAARIGAPEDWLAAQRVALRDAVSRRGVPS